MAPKATKDRGNNLTFVVTTANSAANDATSTVNKKRVRSIAALRSWPERRKRTFEQFAEAIPNTGPSTDMTKAKARPRRGQTQSKDTVQSQSGESARPHSRDSLSSLPSGLGQHAYVETVSSDNARLGLRCRPRSDLVKPDVREHVVVADQQINIPEVFSNRVSDLLTPPPTPEVLSTASDMSEPFNCYPVPRKAWFDRILHHMMTVFAPRGWRALKITRQEGLDWEWFMTQHALSAPALFYVRLLFASGDMIRLGILDWEASYWLQDQAIKAINEALRDPKTAASDPLILAVGRIALHESMYGDREAANTIHRPAQQRMIAMRGGMGALGFPELVKRLMRWSDHVMAMQGGTERFLEDDDANKNFSLNQSVDVSENWFGKDGSELRRKIKISDQVNDSDE